jgi:WD40 repeat protein
VNTGNELGRFEPGPSFFAIFPDGKRLVLNKPQGGFVLWDAAANKRVRQFQGGFANARCMTVSPDGKFFVAASNEDPVYHWDVSTGEQLPLLNGHQRTVDCLAFSRDGKTLASGGHDWHNPFVGNADGTTARRLTWASRSSAFDGFLSR